MTPEGVSVLRKNAKIELLRRVPLFSGCSKRQLGDISMIAEEIDVPAGKQLIREGQRGQQFFVLIEGTVEVTKGGRRVPIRGGAEFFGEISLLTDVPTIATVTTTSSARALVITRQGFRGLIERSSDIQLRVLRSLADRMAPETL